MPVAAQALPGPFVSSNIAMTLLADIPGRSKKSRRVVMQACRSPCFNVTIIPTIYKYFRAVSLKSRASLYNRAWVIYTEVLLKQWLVLSLMKESPDGPRGVVASTGFYPG
jgi:hypothetical protein